MSRCQNTIRITSMNTKLIEFVKINSYMIQQQKWYVNPSIDSAVTIEYFAPSGDDLARYTFEYTMVTYGGNLIAYTRLDVTVISDHNVTVLYHYDGCWYDDTAKIVKSLPRLQRKISGLNDHVSYNRTSEYI